MSEASIEDGAIDKIWYTRGPVPTPLGLASQLGWFLDEFRGEGIGVYTLQEADDRNLRRSHYDHHLIHSFRQGGSTPALWARARGRRTRVIGVNWLEEYQAIIASPDSGIRQMSELRGRRIGLPDRRDALIDHERASALRACSVALDLAGVAEREVEWVDVLVAQLPWQLQGAPRHRGGGLEKLLAALAGGRVDAIFVRGPHGARIAAELGATVLLDLRSHPDPLVRANHSAPRPITVDQQLLDVRPDIVARFLGRIVDVGDWAAAHPAETFAYVARETGADEAWVRSAYGADLHLRQLTDLDETAIAGLQAYQRFLRRRGFLDQDFDLPAWIDPQPLRQVFGRRSSAA